MPRSEIYVSHEKSIWIISLSSNKFSRLCTEYVKENSIMGAPFSYIVCIYSNKTVFIISFRYESYKWFVPRYIHVCDFENQGLRCLNRETFCQWIQILLWIRVETITFPTTELYFCITCSVFKIRRLKQYIQNYKRKWSCFAVRYKTHFVRCTHENIRQTFHELINFKSSFNIFNIFYIFSFCLFVCCFLYRSKIISS